MLGWIIQNKDIIKIIYGLVVTMICLFIVLKTDRLFKLSFHQGIRYFRNAFFFFGLAFITRYLIGGLIELEFFDVHFLIIKLLFEAFLIMAGFSLLYSLIWRRVEPTGAPKSSLINVNILIFYLITLVIVVMDLVWGRFYFLFLSQIILFIIILIISLTKYMKSPDKPFLKYYSIAMALILSTWILNAVAPLYLNWHQGVIMNIYIINSIVFLLFLFGVIKITED